MGVKYCENNEEQQKPGNYEKGRLNRKNIGLYFRGSK
jgi:hypothetical protein